ncbi:MAG: toprim domain-containing protein, partial [Acidobacteria bacterium]|nr:toprim domain-containing protein [Acidobacteriota bacterium]
REALLKIHEVAADRFREQLASAAGAGARQQLRDRAISRETMDRLGIGYALSGRETLKAWLLAQGFDLTLLVRSGLVVERENGQAVDRFRGRVMIPIARDSGSIVAFAGRAAEPDQQPKYLNSPETPIYSKSRVLYGLHLTKGDIRRLGYAVLVEGYFDLAQARQAGVLPVVAACGTALTPQQAQLLRRFTAKVVLSYDPDAAGQGAAERSSQLLVAEGFQVNVALLPQGLDPDGFVRRHGGAAYLDRLKASRPYLEYLIDVTAEGYDFGSDDSRREFLSRMLVIAAQIPDAAGRDQFGDRLAHKARITEDVVRAEIRKAAVERRTAVTERELPSFGRVKQAEKGLIWSLMHDPAAAGAAMAELEPADLAGLATEHVLELARTLHAELSGAVSPTALLARLNKVEGTLVTGIAAEPGPAAPPLACAHALKRLRFERERADLQREIDRLQDQGEAGEPGQLEALWQRKKLLVRWMESLEA